MKTIHQLVHRNKLEYCGYITLKKVKDAFSHPTEGDRKMSQGDFSIYEVLKKGEGDRHLNMSF